MNNIKNVIFAFLFSISPLLASEYWVSPTGKASNPGTKTSPWNLQAACTKTPPGSTVHIGAGIYGQRMVIKVSGSVAGYTSFVGDKGAIIDGTNIPFPGSVDTGLIQIDGCSYIHVEGLEVRNWKFSTSGPAPAGIYITNVAAPSQHIQLLKNRVHDIWQTASNSGAHGIAVSGTRGESPITDLLIQENQIDHCQLGWSEVMVLNGNIDGFLIQSNRVFDNNNIGIDIAGWWKVAPQNDQARNGRVVGNTVWNIHSDGYDTTSANPAYAPGADGADGIYVDGGMDVIIEKNQVWNCDIGIEVGAEHKPTTTPLNSIRITVRDNMVHTTNQSCIMFGGYKPTLSYAQDCVFSNNTLYHGDINNWSEGVIEIQKSMNCKVFNNILYATDSSATIFGSSAAIGPNNSGNTFDYNLCWAKKGTPTYEIALTSSNKHNIAVGLLAHQRQTVQNMHSIETDPMLVSIPSNIDLHIQSQSKAINTGNPVFVPGTNETDIDGQNRIMAGRVDIGADEFQ